MTELTSSEKKLVDTEVDVLANVLRQGIESIVSDLVATRNMGKTDSVLRAQILGWCNETERLVQGIKLPPTSGKKT
jgi:hypothetical protein